VSWTIGRGAAEYPVGLTQLSADEQPARLHCAGRRAAIALLQAEPVVTIVGSRRASAYGLRVAQRLARDLALAGVVVVSGMARGIDGAAHRGALDAGGTTVAVLANGPDIVYPEANRDLYERILATGAVISEHPPGVVARRHFFPQRNRIMAALAEVVVLVEAAQPSGSLVTADRAAELGRTVGAIPGQLGVRVAEGANDLIHDGAALIRDARDVLDLLFGVGVRPGGLSRVPGPRPGPPLDERLTGVLEAVRAGAGTPDRISIESALEPREAAAALARLELLGYVRADALGGFGATDLKRPAP
jgi:DNA processing protein